MTRQGYREPPPDAPAPRKSEDLKFSADEDMNAETIHIDPDTGAVTRTDPAGGMIIDFNPKSKKGAQKPDKFDANLAEYLSDSELGQIETELHQGIEADINSREDWVLAFNRGVELLGLKIEEASGTAGGDGAISKIHNPLLLEAVVRFQSNGRAELLPSEGPVKVRDDQDEPIKGRNQLAEDLERDMNHYLTTVAKEYYPDFDRLLFALGLGGCAFRKVYLCPLRKRPVSEAVSGKDLIVSNDATDLTNAARVTHRILMRQSTLKRYQLKGYYRDVPISQPVEVATATDAKIKETEGIAPKPARPEDNRHEIWETQVELDLPGFEHTGKKGKKTGLPLPYRVTMEKDSGVILEIRRDWKQKDPEYMKKRRYVKYGMIPGLGFYDYGFVHLVGNTQRALTAIDRMLIDAGTFANFPAFLIAKGGQKQETNVFRLSPGTGQEIDTGGMPIKDAIMELPYKGPSAALAEFEKELAENARMLGTSVDMKVGEGRADVPVGTILAMIEQATKIMSAVHQRLHQSQQEEFEMLRELFVENPTTLSQFAKKPKRQWATAAEFGDLELVPASNPNVPSHIHRIMQATALIQMLTQAQGILNAKEIFTRVFQVLNVEDIDSLFAPPPPPGAQPPVDPNVQKAQIQKSIKDTDVQQKNMQQEREANQAVLEGKIRMQELSQESKDRAADRASREKIALIKAHSDVTKTHVGIAGKRAAEREKAQITPTKPSKYMGPHPQPTK